MYLNVNNVHFIYVYRLWDIVGQIYILKTQCRRIFTVDKIYFSKHNLYMVCWFKQVLSETHMRAIVLLHLLTFVQIVTKRMNSR